MDEYEFEPVRGLPERLPAGERLLWQGSPSWRALAIRAFHVRKIGIYFAVLLAWRLVLAWRDGEALRDTLLAAAWLVPLAAAAIGLLCAVAWLTARSAVYTITDRRVVMRVGVVLEVAFNLPLTSIEGASVQIHRDGTADIPLELDGKDRIAYAHLWPHARPFHVRKPEPMLRCVPDGARVASVLAGALGGTSRAANDAQASPVLAAAR
ncbi:MAG: photosynthetic complex putative assembly protein PuhB [Burkholderiales bacterium]